MYNNYLDNNLDISTGLKEGTERYRAVILNEVLSVNRGQSSSPFFSVVSFLLSIKHTPFDLSKKSDPAYEVYSCLEALEIISKVDSLLYPGAEYNDFIECVFLLNDSSIYWSNDVEVTPEMALKVCLTNIFLSYFSIFFEEMVNLFKFSLGLPQNIKLEFDPIPRDFFKLPIRFCINNTKIMLDLFHDDTLLYIRFVNCEISTQKNNDSSIGEIPVSPLYAKDCIFENCNFKVKEMTLENCLIKGKITIFGQKTLKLNLNNINEAEADFESQCIISQVDLGILSFSNCNSISLVVEKDCTIKNLTSMNTSFHNFIIDGAIQHLPNFINCNIYSSLYVKYNNFGYAECNAFSDLSGKLGCKATAIEYKAYALDAYQSGCNFEEKIPLFFYNLLNNKGRSIWLPLFWLILLIGLWFMYYLSTNSFYNSLLYSLQEVLWPLKLFDNLSKHLNNSISILILDLITKILTTLCVYLFAKGIKIRYELKE